MSHDKIPEFKPEPGGNRVPLPQSTLGERSYADIDFLRRELEKLLAFVSAFQVELENDLTKVSLRIDREDVRFMEAHNSEWPDDLGETSDHVSYRYYRALRLRNTTSASYIRKRYEEAARDVTGNSALDILTLVDLTRSEALLIQEFLDTYVDNLNDSSEQRIVEVFQDWVQPALLHTKELRSYFQAGNKNQEIIPEHEISQASPDAARHGQAVFKVKLNSYNDSLSKNIDYLKKNFSDFAPVFYGRFLGPALDFRLQVSRNTEVSLDTPVLSKEVAQAASALDGRLNSAIEDQARRRTLYNNKLFQLRQDIKERDKYRNLISDLSKRGKAIPTGGNATFGDNRESAQEVEFWGEVEAGAVDLNGATPSLSPGGQSGGSLTSSHGALTDLGENHHFQYLLRSGGVLTGNVGLADGVTIDGVVPSEHRHTGIDGTPQIHGDDIIGGTLKDDVVDPNAYPQTPFNLQVVGHNETVVPPGITLIDTTIAWEGNPANTFEVAITRIYV